METQGEHKKIDLLGGLLAKEKRLLNERKEALYRVEFNLQKCEMKLERIRGYEQDKSEAEKKQAKIEELQAVLNERTVTSKLLQNQIASLEVKNFAPFFFFFYFPFLLPLLLSLPLPLLFLLPLLCLFFNKKVLWKYF